MEGGKSLSRSTTTTSAATAPAPAVQMQRDGVGADLEGDYLAAPGACP